MAATTGTAFISGLWTFLKQASAQVPSSFSGTWSNATYLSFWPTVSQSNYNIVLNELNGTGSNFITGDTGKVYFNNFPAVSVGNSDSIINTMSGGTGTFSGSLNDFLRIGNTWNSTSWTAFIDFQPSGKITGVAQVLLSSKTYVNNPSGLVIGITDSNRLFLEYIDSSYSAPVKKCQIFNKELSTRNLISISQNSDKYSLTISNHNLSNDELNSKTFDIGGFSNNNVLYLGGFPNTGNDAAYTGYKGYITEFFLTSGSMTAQQTHNIAPAFLMTGYIPEYQTTGYTYYPIVTGVRIWTGVFSGVGVTGQQLTSIEITGLGGEITTGYSYVSLSGNVYYSGIEYLSGTSSGTLSNLTYYDEQVLYDNNYLKNYCETNLILLDNEIEANDLLEIYGFSDKQFNSTSILQAPFNLNDNYIYDIYNTGSGVNIYYSGILKKETYPYTYAKTSSGASGIHAIYPNYLFDKISGTISTSGWTGYSGAITLYGNLLSSGTKDLYINGLKLVSGYDYFVTGTDIILTGVISGQPVLWASGYLGFAPSRTGLRNTYTGMNLGYYKDLSANFAMMDEMIWLNGQRLAPTKDYKKAPSISLLVSSTRPEEKTFSIYNENILLQDMAAVYTYTGGS